MVLALRHVEVSLGDEKEAPLTTAELQHRMQQDLVSHGEGGFCAAGLSDPSEPSGDMILAFGA